MNVFSVLANVQLHPGQNVHSETLPGRALPEILLLCVTGEREVISPSDTSIFAQRSLPFIFYWLKHVTKMGLTQEKNVGSDKEVS